MAFPGGAEDFKGWPRGLRRKIILDRTGIAPRWEGAWLLGEGGFGVAALWLEFDYRQRVADRMVVKTNMHLCNSWWDPKMWSDGLDAQGNRDHSIPINHESPQEAILHQRLTERVQPPQAPRQEHPICEYRGRSAVDQRNRRWKYMMEYCSFGSLQDFNALHIDKTWPPSEPFIWYVAEEVLLAAQLMWQGATTGGTQPGWRPIVHRDLKPDNILLTNRDPNRFRHFPRIKVTDFGLAVETGRNDPNNPIDFIDDDGTPNYLPPEQRRWYKPDGTLDLGKQRRISEKTSVWQIGMICWSLMHMADGWPMRYTSAPDDRTPPIFNRDPTHSARLEQFVHECLEFKPSDRPTIAQALDTIRNPGAGVDNFRGMENAVPRDPLSLDQNEEKLWLFHENDKYRVGMAKPSI